MYRVAVCALAIVIGAVAAAGAAGAGSAALRCNLWVSPAGEDTDPGTQSHPLRTLTRLAVSLAPGQVGCLAPGSRFADRELITAVGSAKGRITITTAPGGARAVLGDGIETTQASRYLTLTNLTIEGTSKSKVVPGTVVVRGFSTALTHSEVGPGTLKETGRSCVVLDHAGTARVTDNVLHECNGSSPGLYSAGVLAATSAGARILDNVIYGNAGGDGIAFSPNAQASLATGNLVVSNLGGIYFGGDAKTASRDNRVEQNVIALSDRFDVHSGFGAGGGPVGARNTVIRNCLWSPGAVTGAGIGFTLKANRKVNPRVVKANGRYRLAGSSPCSFARATASPSSVSGILFGS